MTEAAKLRPLLSSEWKPATEVASEAEALGITRDQLRAARTALGVTRETGGVARRDGRWWWRLPDGCPTCGRSWRESWAMAGQGGDYWADSRPSSAAKPDDHPAITTDDEPPSPPSWASRYEPVAASRCSVCGRTSAQDPGRGCPWFNATGQRCPGTVR